MLMLLGRRSSPPSSAHWIYFSRLGNIDNSAIPAANRINPLTNTHTTAAPVNGNVPPVIAADVSTACGVEVMRPEYIYITPSLTCPHWPVRPARYL